MLFRELVEVFGKIEKTTLRNEIMMLLAKLMRQADTDEVMQVVYLAMGELKPKFDRLEFNLADKMVVRAIARARGKTIDDVVALYKSVGDLGVVAASIEKGNYSANLTVMDVYTELTNIAKDSGVGSQERKVDKLAKLIALAGAEGAKYIVRIVLGKLRLGFSDKTILDALSYMETGTKESREALDEAYQVAPDVAELAKLVKEMGVAKAHTAVRMKIGRPMMPALAQRLRTADEMVTKMGTVQVEPKYDGTRCVGGYTGVYALGRGYITVRELRVGDKVLTHLGNFKRVVGKVSRSRHVGERVYTLQTFMGDGLRISEGHKIYIYRPGGLDWVPIEEINPGEWVYFPIPIVADYPEVAQEIIFSDKAGYTKKVFLNTRVMRFLGFWVGDGFSNTSHQMERLGITCNAKNIEQIAFYEAIIRDELHIADVKCDVRHGAANLYWRDPVMRRWLCEHFRGAKESGKKIPDWFFGLDKVRWEAFLQGWRDADGTSRHSAGYLIVTKEREMAMMGQLLSLKHNIAVGIRRIRQAAQTGNVGTYYQLIFSGTEKNIKKFGDGYLAKIKTLSLLRKNVNHRLMLYDIEVEGDQSFCISVASLHNCQIHFKRDGFEMLSEQTGSLSLFDDNTPLQVRTFTRNLDENTEMFPELTRIESVVKANEVILDSEGVGYDPKTGKMVPFQTTITRKRKHGVEAATAEVPLRFFVFDILYKDGETLINLPLSQRREILKETIKDEGEKGLLVVDDAIVTSDPQTLREYHAKQLAQGLEGALVKKVEGKYLPGRQDWNWVKFKEEEGQDGKLSDTIDAVVMGYYLGRGKRQSFGLGAFLVGIRDGLEIKTLAKIGTGLSDEQFGDLFTRLQKCIAQDPDQSYVVDKNLQPDVWVAPSVVVEIAADEITKSPIHSSGYALRFPRLVRFRDDKRVDESTTLGELKEIGGL